MSRGRARSRRSSFRSLAPTTTPDRTLRAALTAATVLAAPAVLGACSSQAVPSLLPTSFVAPSAPNRSPAAVASAAISAIPTARPTPPPTTTPFTGESLQAAVDVGAMRVHVEELQRIADANGGNRATGTTGFVASMAYVTARLEAAGYRVDRQAFAHGGATGSNLLAELPGTEPARVVMLGAHLDSGPNGPGINDNGSGVAAVLAIADALPRLGQPAATLRFGFWDAEEVGRQGSSAYVAALDGGDLARIAAYLNLDIIGSPNFVRFVYSEPNTAPGSDAITDLFAAHFAGQDLPWEPIDLTGKTDHAPFTDAGIPTGGLFSGGTEPKTAAQAAAFGGTAGAPADPCIHTACDRIGSINDGVLGEMADGAAHVLAELATTTGSR